MAAKIHSGDEVIVLTGKDKGKHGRVKRVLSIGKVILEQINLIKKHQKPIPALNKVGGVIVKESPIHISNVAIYNKITGKADRIGFKWHQGKKQRFFKKNNEYLVE
ncbi:MAG: 50S ribosomal protein L24 [Candidatus Dasytiphilus stammeri]